MGKRTIELTLKELVDLGIVKRKKKRRKGKRYLKKGIPVRSSNEGLVGSSQVVASSVFNPQTYTDALRLRDAQTEANTRLLELKQNEEDVKRKLLQNEAFQQYTEESFQQGGSAFRYIMDNLPKRGIEGYDDTDNIGAFARSTNDSEFKAQIPSPPQYLPSQQPPQQLPLDFFGVSPEDVLTAEQASGTSPRSPRSARSVASSGGASSVRSFMAPSPQAEFQQIPERQTPSPRFAVEQYGSPKIGFTPKGLSLKQPVSEPSSPLKEAQQEVVQPAFEPSSIRRIPNPESEAKRQLLLEEYKRLGGTDPKVLAYKQNAKIQQALKKLVEKQVEKGLESSMYAGGGKTGGAGFLSR